MDDGTRCLATTPDDTDLYTAMETQEFIGKNWYGVHQATAAPT